MISNLSKYVQPEKSHLHINKYIHAYNFKNELSRTLNLFFMPICKYICKICSLFCNDNILTIKYHTRFPLDSYKFNTHERIKD